MDAVADSPVKLVNGTRNPGSRSGHKALIAKALLNAGESIRNVQKASQLSVNTVLGLRRSNVVPAAQVEAVRKQIRGEFALVAGAALDRLSDEKLDQSTAVELVKIARHATEMAALAPPLIREVYAATVVKYVKSTGSETSEKTSKTCTILKTDEAK